MKEQENKVLFEWQFIYKTRNIQYFYDMYDVGKCQWIWDKNKKNFF